MLLDPFLLERVYLETRKRARQDARTKMRKRRYNALKKAYQRLIENPFVNYGDGEMLVLSDTVTEKGEPSFYRTSAKECRLKEPGDVLFDEAEDDARWSELIEEIDKLIEESEEMEAARGRILMEYKLSDMKFKEEEFEDGLF